MFLFFYNLINFIEIFYIYVKINIKYIGYYNFDSGGKFFFWVKESMKFFLFIFE